jgi:hypothetical protein
MPQQNTSGQPPEYAETTAPENPPNSVVRPAGRAALVTYLGGIVVLFLLFGAAFAYWTVTDKRIAPRDGDLPRDPSAIGTSGERTPREGTPGGFDPAPSFDRTRDELEYRGSTERRVEFDDVQVERTDGDTFWVRNGDTSVAVVAPGGMPTVRAGQRVDLTGTVEASGRIRANRIDVK